MSQESLESAAADEPEGRLRLSVLETTPVGATGSGYAAVRQSVDVAVAADTVGYHRVWVTEHHASATIASSAPAVLVAALAARTTRIRVGSGGVMLSNHQPLVVAEQFGTLEALYAGRIDLGVGGAAGAPSTAVYERALGRTSDSAGKYPRMVDDLVGFLSGTFPPDHAYAALSLSPRVRAVPVYVLGSSAKGAGLAAERGLPFVFAHHLGLTAPGPVLDQYRASFRPAGARSEPYVILSVVVACASTDSKADEIAFTVGLSQVRRRAAAKAGVPYTERLLEAPVTQQERDQVRRFLSSASVVTGTGPAAVRRLAALADATGADELMVVPMDLDGPGRIRTLRLLAQASVSVMCPAIALEVE
ncbi:MsnO8 family LLM class oxidoreductase [Streptomyces sp. NPDC051976]|uniref:MsnO8 family LLM class oxidoreductase n=1 Tax=Streptomyces sp. NPDC051976 TaxID=3154947 RepID=UPI00343EE0D8